MPTPTDADRAVAREIPDGVMMLRWARDFLDAAQSIRAHPLRNTHANDVPVLMAQFASTQLRRFARHRDERIAELERENARLRKDYAHCEDALRETEAERKELARENALHRDRERLRRLTLAEDMRERAAQCCTPALELRWLAEMIRALPLEAERDEG